MPQRFAAPPKKGHSYLSKYFDMSLCSFANPKLGESCEKNSRVSAFAHFVWSSLFSVHRLRLPYANATRWHWHENFVRIASGLCDPRLRMESLCRRPACDMGNCDYNVFPALLRRYTKLHPASQTRTRKSLRSIYGGTSVANRVAND